MLYINWKNSFEKFYLHIGFTRHHHNITFVVKGWESLVSKNADMLTVSPLIWNPQEQKWIFLWRDVANIRWIFTPVSQLATIDVNAVKHLCHLCIRMQTDTDVHSPPSPIPNASDACYIITEKTGHSGFTLLPDRCKVSKCSKCQFFPSTMITVVQKLLNNLNYM